MTTPEGNVKADIKAWLEWLGWWYLMPVKHTYGRVGIPDFLICAGGYFLAVETKRPGNEDGATPRQKEELQAVRTCGGWALVCTSLDQLKEFCYADPRIKEKLPSRGSEGEPQATSRAPRTSASQIRV
jgi:hypothetical protein